MSEPGNCCIQPKLAQLRGVSFWIVHGGAIPAAASATPALTCSNQSGAATASSTPAAASASFLFGRFYFGGPSGGEDGTGDCGQKPEPEEVQTKEPTQASYHQVPRIQRPAQRPEAGPCRPVRSGDVLRTASAAAATLPPVAVGMAAQVPPNHPAGQGERRHCRRGRGGQQCDYLPRRRASVFRGKRYCTAVVICGFGSFSSPQQWQWNFRRSCPHPCGNEYKREHYLNRQP